MSRPLNHRRMNLRVDSCLDVSYWDCCPQQTLPILLHGHLAASMCTHMAGWRHACLQVSWIVSLGPRCQANMGWSNCLLNYAAFFSEITKKKFLYNDLQGYANVFIGISLLSLTIRYFVCKDNKGKKKNAILLQLLSK